PHLSRSCQARTGPAPPAGAVWAGRRSRRQGGRHGTDRADGAARPVDSRPLQARGADVRPGADARANHGETATTPAGHGRPLRGHRMARGDRRAASGAGQTRAGGRPAQHAIRNVDIRPAVGVRMGVPAEKLRDVLTFETSPAFGERERAALRVSEQVTRAELEGTDDY